MKQEMGESKLGQSLTSLREFALIPDEAMGLVRLLIELPENGQFRNAPDQADDLSREDFSFNAGNAQRFS